jgi:hypothetical protein
MITKKGNLMEALVYLIRLFFPTKNIQRRLGHQFCRKMRCNISITIRNVTIFSYNQWLFSFSFLPCGTETATVQQRQVMLAAYEMTNQRSLLLTP